MHHFQYVPKKQWAPFRNEIISLLHDAQNDLREKFTFQYQLIGSASYNMVTMDPTTNIGFDFDFNLIINNPELFPPKQFKEMLISRINRHSPKYGYNPAEDSTRVITIKVKDRKNSKILHSIDFAIVYDYTDDEGYSCQDYIHNDKHTGRYLWEEQPSGYYGLPDMIAFCKENDLWNNEVKTLYLQNKNRNNNPHKKSRSIFSQTLNTVCQRNGYSG